MSVVEFFAFLYGLISTYWDWYLLIGWFVGYILTRRDYNDEHNWSNVNFFLIDITRPFGLVWIGWLLSLIKNWLFWLPELFVRMVRAMAMSNAKG